MGIGHGGDGMHLCPRECWETIVEWWQMGLKRAPILDPPEMNVLVADLGVYRRQHLIDRGLMELTEICLFAILLV